MRFDLIDRVVEQSQQHIVAVKQVSMAEEYLGDHFPGFPILPGVMMVETMVQAARRMLADRGDSRLVLGEVKALKFGQMVRPGESLEVHITLNMVHEDGSYECKGTGRVCRNGHNGQADETAVSGRFTMRPVRME
jgi:3-hydroxyacyl-[acyl-carrier-protein] dehydratase